MLCTVRGIGKRSPSLLACARVPVPYGIYNTYTVVHSTHDDVPGGRKESGCGCGCGGTPYIVRTHETRCESLGARIRRTGRDGMGLDWIGLLLLFFLSLFLSLSSLVVVSCCCAALRSLTLWVPYRTVPLSYRNRSYCTVLYCTILCTCAEIHM